MSQYNILTPEMENFMKNNKCYVFWYEMWGAWYLCLRKNNREKRYLVGNMFAKNSMTFEHMYSVLKDMLREINNLVGETV